MSSTLRFVNRLEEGIIAFLLAAMVLLQFVQVILRYVFSAGLVWALEATTYMFAWMVMIGISYGIKAGSHIAVDALVNALPRGGKRTLGLIAVFLSAVYAVIMTYGGWNYFSTVWKIGVMAHELPIQRWILVSVLPLGFALLLFRLLQLGWQIIRGEIDGFRVANEAADAMLMADDPALAAVPDDRARRSDVR